MTYTLLQGFSNIGHRSGGRGFYGFADPAAALHYGVDPRAAKRLDVAAGDLVSIDISDTGGQAAVLAFSETGDRAEAHLGLPSVQNLDLSLFEAAPLLGWAASLGLAPDMARQAVPLAATSAPLILRAPCAMTLWVLHLQSRTHLIGGTTPGTVALAHQRSQTGPLLPPPLGDVREEFTVPRGTAHAYAMQAGETVQIIDIEGQQCSDFQALTARSLDAGVLGLIDSTATRSMVRRAYPQPGLLDKFFDADMRPMLRVVQDTCGRHDTFGLACTARSYEERGFPGHINCSDNISAALDPYGVAARAAWPAINFFWSTWVDAHHQIQTEESHSRPGDYVAMEALEDLVCVTTACPDDIDPINGWNPTDVHVRIYRPDTRLTHAVAYHPKEDAPMQISTPSPFHARTSALTDHFAPARDSWAPVSFPSHGTLGEYWACRKAATLQDMSALRKYDIIGPDAGRLLQRAMTRDIAKLAQWRGTYALMCDESGQVIDDGTLFRLGPQLYRWCCGTEECGRWLTELGKDLQVRVHDLGGSLPNLALQGPKARDILARVAFTQPTVPALAHLRWFGATVARIGDRDGAPFFLTRTGYTGELGYELFCAETDALTLWDALMEAGAEDGLVPMGGAALEMVRIEAGLAARAEFGPGADAYEAGVGFAVDLEKADFVGKEALTRNATAQRRRLCGLMLECDDVPRHGAPVFAGERQVGQVTSATYAPMFETTIAMAQIAIEHADVGTALEVGQLDGRMKRLTAEVRALPFYDPKRERARA